MAPLKHASARQRRNRVTTARTLTVAHDTATPKLPDGEWNPMTLAWWADVWASPMAPEYDPSDLHGLFLLARLVDVAWSATSPTALKDALGEIRLQRQAFGLTPLDRRRLQWEIDRGEEAGAKTQKRRSESRPASTSEGDPRRLLA